MRSTRLFVVLALAAGMGAVGGIDVFAQNSVITACANKVDGSLRLAGATGTCKASEVAVSWQAVGPQGPEGPAGAEGPAGPQGEPGDDRVITGSVTDFGPELESSKTIVIPDLGSVVLRCEGGGYGRVRFEPLDADADYLYELLLNLTAPNGTPSPLTGWGRGTFFLEPNPITTSFGGVATLWVTRAGSVWKLDLFARMHRFLDIAAGTFHTPCTAAVVATVVG